MANPWPMGVKFVTYNSMQDQLQFILIIFTNTVYRYKIKDLKWLFLKGSIQDQYKIYY